MMPLTKPGTKGFTIIELMIVVAIIAVILSLAAPSFRDFILMQRLRGINAQLVTDLQFARSEAVSRGALVGVRFQSTTGANGMSCYIINTRTSLTAPDCDCTASAGSRCTDASQTTEIRTVQVPNDQSVLIGIDTTLPSRFTIDPRTGGLKLAASDFSFYSTSSFVVDSYIDAARKIRNSVSVSGRVTACAPTGSTVGGLPCP